MWHEWIGSLKDSLEHVWRWLLAAWSASYALFYYLFQPTRAWGMVWMMFLASFATKMVELMWDAEEERLRWTRLKERFSSRTAINKAMPKIISYLFLMFATARAMGGLPGVVADNMHLAFSSFAFANELINCLKHLSAVKGAGIGKLASWVKANIAPKGVDLGGDDE
jgi:hypothetical protein